MATSSGNTLKMMTVDMGADELKPALTTEFGTARKEYAPIWPNFMNKMDINEFMTEFTQVGGFGDIPLLDEGDYINFQKPDLGNKARMQPERRQLAFAITYQDKRYSKVDKVKRAMTKMARAERRTTERVAHVPLNMGFSSTYRPMIDGYPLFNRLTDGGHVRLNGAITANRPPTDVDLDQATLEDAVTAFMGLTDEDGTPISIPPKYLVVHFSNLINAKRILGSTVAYNTTGGRPSASYQGTKNVLADFNLTIISSPFLTDPDAWFLLGDKDEVDIYMITNEAVTDRTFTDPWNEDVIYSISFSNIAGAVSDIATYGTSGG